MRRRLGTGIGLGLLVAVLAGAATGFALTDRGGVGRPVLVRVPAAETTSTQARFAFRPAGARRVAFACSLDGARFRRCGPRRTAYANLRAGRHRFCVVARRGRTRSAPTCHIWTIVPARSPANPATPVPSAPSGDPRPFRIAGTATAPLLPGGDPVPVDLVLANPNAEPIAVESVTMRVEGARPADCAAAIVVTGQLAAAPAIPGGATRSLSGLGIPRTAWPQLAMVDTGTSQDACQGAQIALRFTGRATG